MLHLKTKIGPCLVSFVQHKMRAQTTAKMSSKIYQLESTQDSCNQDVLTKTEILPLKSEKESIGILDQIEEGLNFEEDYSDLSATNNSVRILSNVPNVDSRSLLLGKGSDISCDMIDPITIVNIDNIIAQQLPLPLSAGVWFPEKDTLSLPSNAIQTESPSKFAQGGNLNYGCHIKSEHNNNAENVFQILEPFTFEIVKMPENEETFEIEVNDDQEVSFHDKNSISSYDLFDAPCAKRVKSYTRTEECLKIKDDESSPWSAFQIQKYNGLKLLFAHQEIGIAKTAATKTSDLVLNKTRPVPQTPPDDFSINCNVETGSFTSEYYDHKVPKGWIKFIKIATAIDLPVVYFVNLKNHVQCYSKEQIEECLNKKSDHTASSAPNKSDHTVSASDFDFSSVVSLPPPMLSGIAPGQWQRKKYLKSSSDLARFGTPQKPSRGVTLIAREPNYRIALPNQKKESALNK